MSGWEKREVEIDMIHDDVRKRKVPGYVFVKDDGTIENIAVTKEFNRKKAFALTHIPTGMRMTRMNEKPCRSLKKHQELAEKLFKVASWDAKDVHKLGRSQTFWSVTRAFIAANLKKKE
jgi:hypothetical protein